MRMERLTHRSQRAHGTPEAHTVRSWLEREGVDLGFRLC